ncbi:unnamed protein product [Clavelina lepadiformis]|uniref:Uncharacterized protein n=1 Tax=Clavelina lepadiformis TaxID=159417 RepID=A0ABP0FET9_CLALP
MKMLQPMFIATFLVLLLFASPTLEQAAKSYEERHLPSSQTQGQQSEPIRSQSIYDRFFERPRQLPYPLTLTRCQSNRSLRRLRSCQAALRAPGTLNRLSGTYLCSYRDSWKPETNAPSSRKKRETNHCSGPPHRYTITFAEDADTGTWRELYHDPLSHLFQTIFVEKCGNFGPIGSFHCRMHDIKLKAAVWPLDPSSDDLDIINVVTNSYCALTDL